MVNNHLQESYQKYTRVTQNNTHIYTHTDEHTLFKYLDKPESVSLCFHDFLI